MKPLQAIAMGLVIILLTASAGGFDLLPNPIGWVLVLIGVGQLPEGPDGIEHRWLLRYVAVIALVVSIPVWVPAIGSAIEDADPSLAWARDLPELLFLLLVSHTCGTAAHRSHERRAARWLQLTRTGCIVAILMPIAVFGAGATGLAQAGLTVFQVTLLVIIVLLFAYSGRRWALESPIVESLPRSPDAP